MNVCRDPEQIVDKPEQGKRGAIQRERRASRPHNWQPIRDGRVCDVCLTTQLADEFDDNAPCAPPHA